MLAYKLDILADCGAYPTLGAILAGLTALMSSGVYDIPRVEAEGTTVVTNTTQIAAFRGAGRPEAIQAIECAIDRFAAEIGMDPAEVRRLNYVGEFPHTTASGANYDSGDYAGALDLALRSAGYDELRAEQKRRRDEGGDEAARDRPLLLRRDHEPARRGRARRGRDHRRTAARSSAPARSRTARGTRRASRWSSPSGSGCRSRRSRCTRATPTRSRPARARTARSRSRSAAPPRPRPRRPSSSRRSSSSPTTSRRTRDDVVLDNGARPLPRRRHRRPVALVGGAGGARGERRPAGGAEGGERVPGRTRPSRSARTSRSSRSTPRPAQVELQRMVCVDDAGTLDQPAARRGPGARRRRDRASRRRSTSTTPSARTARR